MTYVTIIYNPFKIFHTSYKKEKGKNTKQQPNVNEMNYACDVHSAPIE